MSEMLLLADEGGSIGIGIWVGETVGVKVGGIVGSIVLVAIDARVMIGDVTVIVVIESAVITS